MCVCECVCVCVCVCDVQRQGSSLISSTRQRMETPATLVVQVQSIAPSNTSSSITHEPSSRAVEKR